MGASSLLTLFGFLAKSSLLFSSFLSHTNTHFVEYSKIFNFLPSILGVTLDFGKLEIKWHFLEFASSKIVGISLEGMILGCLTEIGKFNDL